MNTEKVNTIVQYFNIELLTVFPVCLVTCQTGVIIFKVQVTS